MRKLRLYRCPACHTAKSAWQEEVKTYPSCLQCGTGMEEITEYKRGTMRIRQAQA